MRGMVQRTLAKRVAHEPCDLGIGAVTRDGGEEVVEPASRQAEADDAPADVDEVGAPHDLDLGSGAPLSPQVVVALDRVRAQGRALTAPAVRRDQLPRELGAVAHVDTAP